MREGLSDGQGPAKSLQNRRPLMLEGAAATYLQPHA
jgi:hypothetical protein